MLLMVSLIFIMALVPNTSLGQPGSPPDSEWTLQNPRLQGNNLYAARFVNANDGWVAGANGLIMRTRDGGQTWEEQLRSPNTVFASIDALDADHAVAVGANFTIVTTDDGGATWTSRTRQASGTFLDVTYADPTTLYAVGRAGLMMTSRTGGERWTRLGGFESGTSVAATHFFDDSTGYVLVETGSESQLYFTNTGGVDWTLTWTTRRSAPQRTGISAGQLRFVDRQTGYWIDVNGNLLKTTNGGESWRILPIRANLDFVSVGVADANKLLIVGKSGVVRRSQDGGDSWTTIEIAYPLASLNTVTFGDAQSGYIVGEDGILLKTSDGGATWADLAPGPRSDLSSVAWVTADIAVAVGREAIARSVDQGLTWRTVLSSTRLQLSDVQFFNSQVGIATGNNGIYRTIDGGVTWAPTMGAGADSPGLAITADPTNDQVPIALVTRSGPSWLRTSDLGATWSPVRVPDSSSAYAMSSVQFLGMGQGFAGGAQGIWQTTDAGLHWQPVTGTGSPIELPITPGRYAFPSLTRIYADGQGGQLFRSDDAGRTWQALESGTSADLGRLAFSNEDVGYVVGSAGTILHTADGGVTWTRLDSGVRRYLSGLAFNGQGVGLIVGEGGTVLRSMHSALPSVSLPPTVNSSPLPAAINCPIRLHEGLAQALAWNARVRAKLDCPTEEEYGTPGVEEEFERGRMIWIAADRQIRVTYEDGRWEQFSDTYSDGPPEPLQIVAERRYAPVGRFGKLWREQPGLRDRLGWAIEPERSIVASTQQYRGGLFIAGGSGTFRMLHLYFSDSTTYNVYDPTRLQYPNL